MANEQISLPYLLAFLLVTGLAIRFLFFTPSPSPSSSRQGNGSGGHGSSRQQRTSEARLRAQEAAVSRIQQMFPQVDRRGALWDLQRNGFNVQATTERILAGRLETVSVLFLAS
jgi:coupling of ubiquitin conjugation to ER degradation protein 1